MAPKKRKLSFGKLTAILLVQEGEPIKRFELKADGSLKDRSLCQRADRTNYSKLKSKNKSRKVNSSRVLQPQVLSCSVPTSSNESVINHSSQHQSITDVLPQQSGDGNFTLEDLAVTSEFRVDTSEFFDNMNNDNNNQFGDDFSDSFDFF